MKRERTLTRCLLLTAALVVAGTAGAQTATPSEVGITFNRTGNIPSTVTASVADAGGTAIPGAAATIAVSPDTLKTSGTAVTSSIVCPDTNGDTGQEFAFTVGITGLPEGFTYNAVDAKLWALNKDGGTQTTPSKDGGRTWRLAILQGNDTTALDTFGTKSYDLTTAIPYTARFVGEEAATGDGDTLFVRLVASLSSANGCFIGLESINLYTTNVVGDTVTLTVDTNNGQVTANSTSSSYNNTWTSTQTDPQLTLTVGANNMNADTDGTINLWLGTNTNAYVYTLAASSGWVISAYSFNFTNSDTSVNMTVTPTNRTAVTCQGSGTATVSVTGLNTQTASFTLSNANSTNAAANTSDFTVTLTYIGVEEEATPTKIFTTTSGADSRYRIPAVTRMKDGSLLAIADLRFTTGDIGTGHIDIVGRISDDNGATWGEQFTIADGSGTSGAVDCGYGDAALVTDSATGRVLMICCTGSVGYRYSSRSNPLRTARLYSEDGGKTWSDPEDITEQIYGLFDKDDGTSVVSLFFGSGRIAQSSLVKKGDYYRIYAALCTRSNGNRVVYSDDFGLTWQILGGINAAPAPNGDEPKCEELPDGSVVLSSRKTSGRYFNVFTFTDLENAEGSWGTAVASNNITGGISVGGNSTNGEILIVPAVRNSDGKTVYLALQSIPFAGNRSNVGIWYKGLETFSDFDTPTNFASNWEGSYQVSNTSSAYSTMVMQADGRVAFVYEETSINSGYHIVYIPLSIRTITGNAYSVASSVDRWTLLAESIDEKAGLTPSSFVGQLSKAGAASIKSYMDAFTAAPSLESYYAFMAQTVAPENTLQFDPAKTYRIYNVRATEYINAADLSQPANGSITGNVITGDASGDDALPTLWQFESDGEGAYRLKNLNANAYYLAATGGSSVTGADGASTFEMSAGAASDNWTLEVTNGTSLGDTTYLNAFHSSNNASHTIGTWYGGSSDEGNLWMLEQVDSVTATVGEGGYAAITYPVAVSLPDGLTAYSLVRESGDQLTIDAVDTDVLPAGTPALLGGKAGTYALAIVDGNTDEALATGFDGVTISTAVDNTDENLYTLGTQDGVAGMTLASSSTVAANTTYYATGTDGIDFFYFANDISTGIGNATVEEGDAPATYYDLSGRKVNRPSRGIYVTGDGKKVFIK